MMNSPRRITFITPFGLGQKTTVWARTLPLARELVNQGHTVSILIPPWDTPGDAGKRWVEQGVELIHVKLGGGPPVVTARLVRLVDAFAPDIVHIVKPRAHAGLAQWWLWQRRRIQMAGRRFTAHPTQWGTDHQSPVANRQSPLYPRIFLDIDDWEQAWADINAYPPPLARFLAWQEEWGIRHADGITAASRWLVARAQQYAPQTPVLYLPNGVEVAHMAVAGAMPSATAPQILYFTRFVEVAPAWLAAFWGALHAQLPDAQLLVAGDALQPGRERLYQQALHAENSQAAGQVAWLGYVQPPLLQQLYAQVTCAIFPSDRTPLLEAKCSVKLATTLLHGVPVVASAVGEQAAYGAEGAANLLAPDTTPDAFAQAVVALIRQSAQRQTMIQHAHAHLAAHYRWSALGQQLNTFYPR